MRRLAQARNPYSRWWLWIPGSRYARPGMTKIGVASSLALLATTVITSPIPGRNIPDTGRIRGEIVETIRQVHALGRCRVVSDRHAGPPFLRRPGQPPSENVAPVLAHH